MNPGIVFTSLIQAPVSSTKKSARSSPSPSMALKARQASEPSSPASSGLMSAGAKRAAPLSSKYLVS